jgi:COP9 signalosome complex subunit 4
MEALFSTIDTAVATKDFPTLQNVFSDSPNSWMSVGQGEQRSVAAHFIVKAVEHDLLSSDAEITELLDCFTSALGHLPATVEHAADNTVRQRLFAYLVQTHQDYTAAARVLCGTRIEDSGVYHMTAAEKTDVYVKIAECFLAQDEIAESDAAVSRAGTVVEQIANKEQHMGLILRYKSTYARVLDANRKFLAAASRYHELSQRKNSTWIDADDLLIMLGRAATCAILAPSGPQRQRVLGQIYKEKDRMQQLDSLPEFAAHRSILKQMYTHQILRAGVANNPELKAFENSLQEHQKAIMGDGLTILERGVVEHNMIAVSKIYQDIYISELAIILGVTEAKAESIAAKMIMDGSLHGSIDQVEGLLEFESEDTSSTVATFDRAFNDFCMQVNRTASAIQTSSGAVIL